MLFTTSLNFSFFRNSFHFLSLKKPLSSFLSPSTPVSSIATTFTSSLFSGSIHPITFASFCFASSKFASFGFWFSFHGFRFAAAVYSGFVRQIRGGGRDCQVAQRQQHSEACGERRRRLGSSAIGAGKTARGGLVPSRVVHEFSLHESLRQVPPLVSAIAFHAWCRFSVSIATHNAYLRCDIYIYIYIYIYIHIYFGKWILF